MTHGAARHRRTLLMPGALLVALVTSVLLGPAAAASATPATTSTEPVERTVLLVGIPGLRWSDVTPETMPYLWGLTEQSAIGQMSVRSARSRTCPVDGWVQVGTGNRARYPVPDDLPSGTCQPLPPMVSSGGERARVDTWDRVVEENDELAFGAVPGLLGQTVAEWGDDRGCSLASGPGAGLGAADREGWVDRWVEDPTRLTRQLLGSCSLSVVGSPPLSVDRRLGELAAADQLVRDLDQLRPAESLLMVLGVSDLAEERSQLHTVLVQGPGFDGGVLTSASTRRAPFVQLSDVAPTVLDQLGLPIPPEMPYQPMRTVEMRESDRVGWLRELARQADVQGQLTPPFFSVLVLMQAVLYLGAYLILRRHPRRDRTRTRVLSFIDVVAVAAAAGPAATYLANILPWWEFRHPVPALLASISLAGAALTGVAFAGPWRRHPFGPPGAVAALTAIVLAVDVAVGAPLQLSSLAGYSPIVAGRFVGFGNLAFAIFGTASLLATAALVTGRSVRTTRAIVIAAGAAAVLIDGAPFLGSDFGGVIALVPAFGALLLLATERRVSWPRLGALLGAGVAVVALIATADYLRPAESRSHLGRFVGSLLDGGAGIIVQRKLEANLSLLTSSVLTLMVPIALLFLAFLVRRPGGLLPWTFEQVPTLRAGLVSVLVLGLIGALVNDSGVAIPAMAATVAIPVAVSVVVRCMQRDGGVPEPVSALEGAGRGGEGERPPG